MSHSQRLLTVLVLLSPLVGCGKDNNKTAEGDKSKPADATPAEIAPPSPNENKPAPGAKDSKAPDYKFTMAEFEEATKQERERPGVKSKYDGKVLELSGVVEFPIIDDGKQSAFFTLKSAKPATGFDTFSVTCMCDDQSVYGTLGRGQTIRVRGVYGTGHLKPCEVVEKGPETLVRVTAEQLAKDFTMNREEAVKKYDGKTLVLSGTVSKIKPYAEGLKVNCLELKGDGKTVVECRYNKPEVADRYKVGETVKLVGSTGSSLDGVLNIVPCYPLPK
jgi:hypothetical protein